MESIFSRALWSREACVPLYDVHPQEGQGIAMPTYEYRCRECGHAFEEYQSITADALVLCPNCGKHSLRRVMGGGGGLIFKGSGFYQTDYKNSGSSPSSASTKKEKPADKKPAEKKADSSEPKPSSPPPKKDS